MLDAERAEIGGDGVSLLRTGAMAAGPSLAEVPMLVGVLAPSPLLGVPRTFCWWSWLVMYDNSTSGVPLQIWGEGGEGGIGGSL